MLNIKTCTIKGIAGLINQTKEILKEENSSNVKEYFAQEAEKRKGSLLSEDDLNNLVIGGIASFPCTFNTTIHAIHSLHLCIH
jgi:hypothetical protein